MSKTAILTGGTGFIGSLLAVELIHQGYIIIFLGRSRSLRDYSERQKEILLKIDPNILFDKCNFFETDFQKHNLGLTSDDLNYLRHADLFFHLAADLSFRNRDANRVKMTNTESLRHIIGLCKLTGAKLIFFSTAYVHGRQKHNRKICEEFSEKPLSFHNGYEESKYRAEALLQKMSKKNGFEFLIFRPTIVVDREHKTTTPFGFYSFLIGLEKLRRNYPKLVAGKYIFKIPFPYTETACLNLVPADWAISKMISVAQSDAKNGQVYHFANPNPLKLSDIIEHAFKRGGEFQLYAFHAPAWFVHIYVGFLYAISKLIPSLRIIGERLWLFRYYMTECVSYEMRIFNDPIVDNQTSPSITPSELEFLAKNFLNVYRKRRSSPVPVFVTRRPHTST